jgi:hypothetical protein
MLKQLQHSGIKRTIITGNKFLKRVGENFFSRFSNREPELEPRVLDRASLHFAIW